MAKVLPKGKLKVQISKGRPEHGIPDEHRKFYPQLKAAAVVDDDGNDCYGVIEKVHYSDKACATHFGSLYIVRFQFCNDPSEPDWEDWLDESGEPQTYTRSFDDISLGRDLQLLDEVVA